MQIRMAGKEDDQELALAEWKWVSEENGIVISAMYVYIIPKIPRPHIKASYISYLTNVFTLKEFRNQGIGAKLLHYVQKYCLQQNRELIFVWPSD